MKVETNVEFILTFTSKEMIHVSNLMNGVNMDSFEKDYQKELQNFITMLRAKIQRVS